MQANKIRSFLREQIKTSAISRNIHTDTSTIELTKDEKFGDLTSNCAMVWAKSVGKNPIQLAQELIQEWKNLSEYFSEVTIAGAGFINFKLDLEQWSLMMESILSDHFSFKINDPSTSELSSYHLEFVSANPTGPLNVVSARAAVIGDVLANILKTLNHQVHCEFYVNDAGNQVKLLGISVLERWKELQGLPFQIPDDGYHGSYVIEVAKTLSSRISSDTTIDQIAEWAVQEIVKEQKQTIEKYRTHFDRWFFESELRRNRKEIEVLEWLQQNNYIYESEGALYLKTTITGLDEKDRVVVTSNGTPTYFLPDIAYHLDKYRRGFRYAINFLGPDHHGVIGRMSAAMKLLNVPDDFLQIRLIQQVNLIRNGEIVKMSKRSGEIVTLQDLLNELGDNDAAVDVTRFFFLQRKVSTPLDFDLTLAKKQTEENPAYYVQYAHARICSILRQPELESYLGSQWTKTSINELQEPETKRVLRKLLEYPFVLERCGQALDPNGLATYLMELAAVFHKFYTHHRVIGQAPKVTLARVKLIQAVKKILAHGLSLCRITIPERM
ncbi:MAG: arginine--tRNA ligase [bacterium]|nr:arginine--tRNA ligase [bacterium]